jgi:hypothetical protein
MEVRLLHTGASATMFKKPEVGTYTDADTHDESICGHIAESIVSLGIFRLRAVPFRSYIRRDLTRGVRRLQQPPFTVRHLSL